VPQLVRHSPAHALDDDGGRVIMREPHFCVVEVTAPPATSEPGGWVAQRHAARRPPSFALAGPGVRRSFGPAPTPAHGGKDGSNVGAARVQQRVPADADQVPCLRHAATAFASAHCDHDTEMAIALAVTEACTNVVRHAYPQSHGDVTLSARLDGPDLIFEIIDDGTGITAPSPAAGLGMGLEVMRRLATTHISSNRRGTHVELRFPRRVPPRDRAGA
jgi:anti-sigma regulatory factor (Ser/Thr protein kinase)